MVRALEAEGRPATREEQRDLALYVGWGGLAGAFPDTEGHFTKGFEEIGKRLQGLLGEAEYDTARRSIQYAHYTSEAVISAMWSAVQRLGFTGGKVFEPGMGVGHFAGLMSRDLAANADYNGLELDHTTARIAKQLYPHWGVRQDDFTRAPLPENHYDLVIGNPPFADIAIQSDPKYAAHRFLLHDYFFAKSLDAVRPGGLMAFITSAGTMNKVDPKARAYLADRADFVGGVRLPGTAFKRNAGTEVTTDLLFFRKHHPDHGFDTEDGAVPRDHWVETVEATLPSKTGEPIRGAVNRWFRENPSFVLGEEGFFDKLYQNRYGVRGTPGQDLGTDLAAALERLPADVLAPWDDNDHRADADFSASERKDGSFYLGSGGRLMQTVDGIGQEVRKRGKGVAGGKTRQDIDKIRSLIPIRDALRDVYSADLAEDTDRASEARKRLNATYDAFVDAFGPINKAEFRHRRPNVLQQEAARQEAREEARYAGVPFDEGAFDATHLIGEGASLQTIARARREAREQAEAEGRTFDEGSFDPAEMADVVTDKRPNIDPFIDDPENYRLRAIENYDDATGVFSKRAIFSGNVITRDRKPEIRSVHDGLLYSLNRTGRVDMPTIAGVAGISEQAAIEELGETIFRLPGSQGTYVTRDQYLSGNVKKKLRQARAAADRNPAFQRNVTALEEAQPAPLPPDEIVIHLGMPWIPTDLLEAFGTEALGLERLTVRYLPKLAEWKVEGDKTSSASVSTWGTDDLPAPALIKAALGRRDPRVHRTVYVDGKKTRELDPVATEAGQEKVLAIKARFSEWAHENSERSQRLADLYNEHYNNLVVQDFDGSYLTTPGVSSEWLWRPHQKRVIARIIQDGNSYMAHAVGAGKTSAMIGAGMEMRRLGLVRKPMYVVPNHMLGQFTKEFYEQYPTARIAVADERRFHTHRRKQFIADVASQDLDAVIMTHSAFGMIPVSDRFHDRMIDTEIAEYREVLAETDADRSDDTRITRKRLEKQIERLQQRLQGNRKRADQVFTFEETGVDFLFIDEAHLFRKLDFETRMSNVKGISPEGSKMAWDLYVKSRYLEEINPGRNLVLASGTPVTNTMAELFTVSRYLQESELGERGLGHFDAWAGAFGDTVN